MCVPLLKKSAKMGKIDLGMAAAGAGAGAAFGPIGAGVGGVLGLAGGLFGKDKNKEQLEQQEKLQALELAGNKELMGLSFEQQKQMYDYQMEASSEKNQVKRLKEAGLNPALLYGQGGAGVSAVSGGSGGTGAVTGGQAASAAAMQGAETQQMMMGLQMAKLGAEIKVLEADANQKNTDAEKKKGIDTDVAGGMLEKLKAETENTKMQTAIGDIERSIKLLSGTDQIETIAKQADILGEQLERIQRENKLGNETYGALVTEIEARAANEVVKVELNKAGVNLTEAQIESVTQGVIQRWNEIDILREKNTQGWEGLDKEQQRIAIEEFKAELSKDQPTLHQVGGKIVDRAIQGIWDIRSGIERKTGFNKKAKDWRLTK